MINDLTLEKTQPYTLHIRVRYRYTSDWHGRALLLSDLHIDNPKCDRALLIRHLEEAKAADAPVLIFGDLFCAMQGKFDKRSSKGEMRPEHQQGNYLDALVKTTAEFFEPYRHLIKFITPGNHETAILGRHETDLTDRLAFALGCERGTYAGWVVWVFEYEKSGGKVHTIPMAYHHGYGGGGPVTKDVIQTSRKAVYLPDAKIVVSGHTHDRWIVPISRARLKRTGEQVLDEQLHIKLGTYKDEYTAGKGWAVEKGMPPKPLGGAWLHFKPAKFEMKYWAELCQ